MTSSSVVPLLYGVFDWAEKIKPVRQREAIAEVGRRWHGDIDRSRRFSLGGLNSTIHPLFQLCDDPRNPTYGVP
jgi:hypothetical protein